MIRQKTQARLILQDEENKNTPDSNQPLQAFLQPGFHSDLTTDCWHKQTLAYFLPPQAQIPEMTSRSLVNVYSLAHSLLPEKFTVCPS